MVQISKKRFRRITPIQNSIYFVTTAAVNTTVAVPGAVPVPEQQQLQETMNRNVFVNGRVAETNVDAVDQTVDVGRRKRRRTSIISEPKEPPIIENNNLLM